MVGADGVLPLPWLGAALDAISRESRGHALLLHGPRGVGQFDLAVVLAQAWLCEARDPADARPCGRCASCKLMLAHSHPDLMVLLPEVLREPLGWTTGDDDEPADAESRRKPSREIKVDAVRAAVAFSQRTSSRGGSKVVVIHPADAMNPIAANTLLKTLEEPPPAVRFVLCCAAPGDLLPTIRSRCQPWRMAPPERSTAAAWLASQGVSDAPTLLAATGDEPLTALQWARDGIDAKTLRSLADCVRRGDASALAKWPVPRVVEALMKLAHDCARVGAGAAPRFFDASGLRLPRDASALGDWLRELARVQRHVDHPWHAPLVIETLVTQGRRALS